MKKKPKIIIILGPTASGKSDCAVAIAKQVDGEVISADSRQIYRELDIGTGKITKKEMRGVPHHLIDVASPKKIFTADMYRKKAHAAVYDIIKRKRIPIVCGGTGFYIETLVDGTSFPEVPPDAKLRKELSVKSASELFALFKKLDASAARKIDQHNPRRLVRAIEIAKAIGKIPPLKKKEEFTPLFIGLMPDNLEKRIGARLKARIRRGMIAEGRRLHKEGLSYERMESLGLEYKFLALLLRKKISRADFEKLLKIAIRQYAKRQMRWFKRDKRIAWFRPNETKKILAMASSFIGGSDRT